MAKEKNIATNEFIKENAIFADIVNYVLYDGKQVVLPENLQDKDTTEHFLWDENEQLIGKEMMRDILKLCVIKDTAFAEYIILGIENQTDMHYSMPVRNLLYDALTYSRQVKEIGEYNRKNRLVKSRSEFLSGMRKDDKLIPVITITICYDSDRWDGAKTLKEMLYDAGPEVMKYVPDYNMCLITPQNIQDFTKFRTEFGVVMKFVAASKDKKALRELVEKDREKFSRMSRKAAEAMKALTKLEIEIQELEGGCDMCKGMEDWLQEVRAEGKEEGREEGTAMLVQAIGYVRSGNNTVESLAAKGIPADIAKTAIELG